MKLEKYLMVLNKLVKDNPKYAELEVIYSADDEGNAYQKVVYTGTPVQIHGLKSNYVELVGFKGEKNIAEKDINAICIN